MFKIGKPIELNEQIEIFLSDGATYRFDKNFKKHKNYDIRKYLHEGETFLGANGVFYEANIQGNILRFNNNKYIIEITFNTEDNDYCGYLEFDFLLDDYLNE